MSLLPRPATLPSNAQLTALLDGVGDLLLVLDARLRVSYRNPVAQQVLGCEAGQPAEQALARLDAASRRALLAALGPGTSGEPLVLHLADGPQAGRRLALSLQRGPGGGWALRAPMAPPPLPLPPLAAGATSELVRLLWDAPQPLTVQDRNFVMVAANRALFEVLGRSPEDVLGHDPMGLFSPGQHAEAAQMRADWLQALEAGRQPADAVERQVLDAQGRLRIFRYAPRWVSADDGAPLLLAILQDVTLEHQARDAAAQSDTQLDRAR